ncbi:MAG: hypothetical protein J6X18_10415 [Bacteroidales bacterium]|nr:hypothetical protein [Bacteroidales bacterium]
MTKTIRLTKKELNEIVRKITNEVYQKLNEATNYASKLCDNELNDYTYLSAKDTGLPYEIYVDSGQAYKRNKHPLCLYVVRGKNLTPVTISYTPVCLGRLADSKKVKDFIIRNYWALKQYADMDMDSGEFYDSIDFTYAQEFLFEMGNLKPKLTGLPVIVWIDETQAYKRSNHNQSYRMKFQQDKDLKDYYSWMPLLLPSLEIHESDKIPPCKISQDEVNLVIRWAKLNIVGLMLLKDAKISGRDFKRDYMVDVDGVKVIATHIDKVPSYKEISDERYGYKIVKSDLGKFNLKNENGHLISPNTWFDKVRNFEQEGDDIVAYGLIGGEWKKYKQ